MKDPEHDVYDFGRQLASAVEWCTRKKSGVLESDRFWTSDFRPPQLAERPSRRDIEVALLRPVGSRGPYLEPHATFASYTHSVRREMVRQVVAGRERALGWNSSRVAHYPLDLVGGRLLAFDPDNSLADGAAEDCTDRFFDWFNLPTWDTWVWYAVDETRRDKAKPAGEHVDHNFVGCLVSWIPPQFLNLVNSGIDANLEGCLRWVDTLDIGFSQAMSRLGLV